MWKDDATAADILLAAQDIQRFAAGMSYEDFLNNDLVQAAVVQRILRMGEAAKRLWEEFPTSHPQIKWKQIARMRDRCIHRYHDIRLETVWEVITVDAPATERYLKRFVRQPSEGR